MQIVSKGGVHDSFVIGRRHYNGTEVGAVIVQRSIKVGVAPVGM